VYRRPPQAEPDEAIYMKQIETLKGTNENLLADINALDVKLN